MGNFTQEALDFLKDIIVILVIVVVIRTFLIMPFQINGQSMYESYYDKEFIIVDRFSYRNIPFFWQSREVRRWDVVVFTPGVSEERKYFIKRVIGLPGETIKIEDGKVYLQDKSTQEFVEIEEGGYLSNENNKNTSVRGDRSAHVYSIPKWSYFVMGDNRNHSTDSRTCFQSCSVRINYIVPSEITGRVLLDLGYFDFSSFSFTHPVLWISTIPKLTKSKGVYSY